MKDFSASLDIRRRKIWAHMISSCMYPSKDLSCQFPGAQSAMFLLSIMNSSMGCWKSAAAHDLILVGIDGKNPQQVPVCGDTTLFEYQYNSGY